MSQGPDRQRKPRTKFKLRADIARQLDVSLPDETERSISPNEAADMLGITGEAVKQWIYQGRLPAVRLGNGYWRIKVSDLSQFLNKKLGSPQHNVLITPCDKLTLDAIVKTVEGIGQTALVANSAIDAQLKFKNESPSVLILDLSHASGWTMLENVSSLTLRGLLLVTESAFTDEQFQRITKSPAKAVLQKPLDEAVLQRELHRAFGKR
jgi:excisionase family DNA binding protein